MRKKKVKGPQHPTTNESANYLQALRNGYKYEVACDLAGFSYNTLLRIRRRDAVFAIEERKAKAIGGAGMIDVCKKHPVTSWKMLKNVYPKAYREEPGDKKVPVGVIIGQIGQQEREEI